MPRFISICATYLPCGVQTIHHFLKNSIFWILSSKSCTFKDSWQNYIHPRIVLSFKIHISNSLKIHAKICITERQCQFRCFQILLGKNSCWMDLHDYSVHDSSWEISLFSPRTHHLLPHLINVSFNLPFFDQIWKNTTYWTNYMRAPTENLVLFTLPSFQSETRLKCMLQLYLELCSVYRYLSMLNI